MAAIIIEKGDTIVTKSGRTIKVLTTFYNGDTLTKIEGIDPSSDSPMRTPVFSYDIVRLLKKAEKKEEAKKEEKK